MTIGLVLVKIANSVGFGLFKVLRLHDPACGLRCSSRNLGLINLMNPLSGFRVWVVGGSTLDDFLRYSF